METQVTWLAVVMIVVLALDAIACSIPISYIKNDLDRLGCTPSVQRMIPIVKFAAVTGFVIGLYVPLIGFLAGLGMIVYFFIAFSYHAQAGDPIVKYIPAVVFLSLIAAPTFISYFNAI